MDSFIYVNNLPLPSALVTAIERGVWQTPKNADVWLQLFPKEQIVQPLLYTLEGIQKTNAGWWIKESQLAYLGEAGAGFIPGDIDPTRSLLIADLGPDRLIALDYRTSENRPSVVSLTSEESYWVKVTDDVESFIRILQLELPVR